MLRSSLLRVLPTLAVVAMSVTLMGCPPPEVGDRGDMNRGSNLTSEPAPDPEPAPEEPAEEDAVEATTGESA